jgi:diguanylate cyclase (GGDEF)-like protein
VAAPALPQTIVCVDDDPTVLRSLGEQLRRGLGRACTVELASSGADALALIEELAEEGVTVSLLISDQTMPRMRGTELLARVHERHPAMLKILLTGHLDADAVGQAVNRANLYRVLAKPWQEDDLLMTVHEALRRVAQEQALAERSVALERSNDELARSMTLLHATLDATHDGILVLDNALQPNQLNRRMAQLWSIPAELAGPQSGTALVAHLREQLAAPDALAFEPGRAPAEPVVLDLRDGRAIEYSCRPHELGGAKLGSVVSFRDVTERERASTALLHHVRHDGLTGLPNRKHFDEALARALAGARQRRGRTAVLFIDLDHFKRINDTLGHGAGDELLRAAATRLGQCVRGNDLLARWGGDEFIVLLPDIHNADEALAIGHRLLEALAGPLTIAAQVLHIQASIGAAVFPEDGEDAATLVAHADMALYRVKAEGRNGVRTYCELPGVEPAWSLPLEADLHQALANGELLLHYQPQIDTRTGAVHWLEALARWHHPTLGWVPPSTFIPIAERTGLILPLGEWVLETACRDAAAWQARGWPELGVAVNLSAKQFDRGDLPDTVLRALTVSGLEARWLELEVTEATALRNVELTAATLLHMQASGVRIALDDFGTGFASFAYLKQLPCQTLKIDRSFVSELRAGSKDAAIVSALVALGDGLGMRVVAEGVETEASCAVLQGLNCWTMQGYLYSHPLPIQALLRELPTLGTPDRVIRVG